MTSGTHLRWDYDSYLSANQVSEANRVLARLGIGLKSLGVKTKINPLPVDLAVKGHLDLFQVDHTLVNEPGRVPPLLLEVLSPGGIGPVLVRKLLPGLEGRGFLEPNPKLGLVLGRSCQSVPLRTRVPVGREPDDRVNLVALIPEIKPIPRVAPTDFGLRGRNELAASRLELAVLQDSEEVILAGVVVHHLVSRCGIDGLARGFVVAHIKTDSIKIPNATMDIIQFCYDFARKYGYVFEHEATYEKMVLVNKAVYIAKYATLDKCRELYENYTKTDHCDFFLEEPCAHLFPATQSALVKWLVERINAEGRQNNLYIATHSPYIMTSFNNLIEAGNVYAQKPKVKDALFSIIPENQLVRFEDVSAYIIRDGGVASLMNEEYSLIDADELDAVSDVISREYSQILDL